MRQTGSGDTLEARRRPPAASRHQAGGAWQVER